MALPDRRAIFQAGRRYVIAAPNTQINPKVVDIDGSDLNLLLNASAVMGEEVVAAFAQAQRGNFVDTSQGIQTDRVIYDRYGLMRFPATAATDDLVLSRPTAGAGAGVYPAGSRVQTPTGVMFSTDVDTVFGALDLIKTVSATALVTGPAGQVGANQLVQFVDPPFDPTLAVTNPAGAAGGNDVETQASFKGRAHDFFRSVRRGTLGAIAFGARQVPGIQVSTAFEILNPASGYPAAAVEVIIADQNGASSSSLVNQARREELNWRAAGIPVYLSGGSVVFEPVTWKLQYATDVDTVSVEEQVRAITVAAAQNNAPGQILLRATLIAVARTVPGAIVTDASLVAPAGDVVPADNQHLIRIQPQDITFAH